MSEDTQTTTDRRTVREDGLRVFDGGRLTIPKPVRDEFDLIANRLVQIRLPEYGASFTDTVDAKGRIRIPKDRIRDEHGIEDGDPIDVEIIA